MNEHSAISVTELNTIAESVISNNSILANIKVCGEISNYKRHSTGHLYFSLKDEKSRVNCIMFRSDAERLSFAPIDGQKVVASGRASIYAAAGQFQLYIRSMQTAGQGELWVQFERLKKKLEQEGLFDSKRKKVIPKYPNRIAIITSPTGAAVRDIIHVSKRRNPSVKLLVVPVLVQGPEAPLDIAKAIEYVNTRSDIDTIIVGRGGGAIEELWAFNEEIVARAVSHSRIPIISAVGHETDFTIADFAADLRAPTPSAASELCVTDSESEKKVLKMKSENLVLAMQAYVRKKKNKLTIKLLSSKLNLPASFFDLYRQREVNAVGLLETGIDQFLKREKEVLVRNLAKLEGLNPVSVMKRGFALIYEEENNTIIQSASAVRSSDALRVNLYDGSIHCVVRNVVKGGYNEDGFKINV